MDFIEEVALDLSDFEIIEKSFRAVKGPCIFVGKTTCCVNYAGTPFIPKFFKWYINDEWCVLKKCGEKEKNAYKSRIATEASRPYTILRCPSALEGATTFRGSHKLYKTRDGVAFRKYEEVTNDN